MIDWSSSRAIIQKLQQQALARALNRYGLGVVVDLGCGDKPYEGYTQAKKYIGVDKKAGDIRADVLNPPLPRRYADAVICTQVLEHLQDPQKLFRVVYRLLKTNGYLILTTPMVWPLHDEPDDYWRFTDHGLKHLAKTAGFKVKSLRPLGGFIATIWQLIAILLERPTYHPGFWRQLLKHLLRPFFRIVQPLVYQLDQLKPVKGLTLSYLLICQKQ